MSQQKSIVKTFAQQYEEKKNRDRMNHYRALAALCIACVIVVGIFACLWISHHWDNKKSDQTFQVQPP